MVYAKTATVLFNGITKAEEVSITSTSSLQEAIVGIPNIDTGETLKVDAEFKDPNNKNQIMCSTTFTAIAPQSLGCGPIEIYYQAYNNSCVIICN